MAKNKTKKRKNRNKKYNPIKYISSSDKAVFHNHLNDLIYINDDNKLSEEDIEKLLNPITEGLEYFKAAKANEKQHVIFVESCFSCISAIEKLKKCSFNCKPEENDLKLILRLEADIDLETIHDVFDPIIDELLKRSRINNQAIYLRVDEIIKVKDILIPTYRKYLKYLTSGLLVSAVKQARITLMDSTDKKYDRYKIAYEVIEKNRSSIVTSADYDELIGTIS